MAKVTIRIRVEEELLRSRPEPFGGPGKRVISTLKRYPEQTNRLDESLAMIEVLRDQLEEESAIAEQFEPCAKQRRELEKQIRRDQRTMKQLKKRFESLTRQNRDLEAQINDRHKIPAETPPEPVPSPAPQGRDDEINILKQKNEQVREKLWSANRQIEELGLANSDLREELLDLQSQIAQHAAVFVRLAPDTTDRHQLEAEYVADQRIAQVRVNPPGSGSPGPSWLVVLDSTNQEPEVVRLSRR